MSNISIYIDSAGDLDDTFARNLIEHLNHLISASVVTYNDISVDEHDPDDWENITANAIRDADVVIPLLSASYLQYVTVRIEGEFDRVIDSNHRYLFPILMKPSDWSSYNWVVRSKLIPSDEKSVSECSDLEAEQVLDKLVKTIKNIVASSLSDPILKESTEEKEFKTGSSLFISHDHSDADFAELLKLKLEKHGLASWIDSERLKIGQDWREEIDRGIEDSMAMIVIMTPDARKSEYVTYEWAFAWGKGKKIFPIMLKQTQLHPRLESLQYMDFTNRALRPWDDLISVINDVKG